jgi:release factor glutamine methyltransferase
VAAPVASSSAEAPWTVGRILDWTAQHLKKHGSESPRLEAEILLAHARKCPRIQLYVQYNEPLSDDERLVMRELVKRRAAAEPVAYLVGHREFFGLDFRVSPAVLIPRPETETLVLELVTAAKRRGGGTARGANRAESSDDDGPMTGQSRSVGNDDHSPTPPLKILDLCTGSGCIAVSAAVNLPTARVTAIDISSGALQIAQENAARHGVAERIQFLEGNLFDPAPAGIRFDFIVSNPPYVTDGEMETLPADVRLHEPHLALRAGSHGMDLIERIASSAAQFLTDGGLLLFEFSPEQAPAVVECLEGTGSYGDVVLVKDASGKLRMAKATARLQR